MVRATAFLAAAMLLAGCEAKPGDGGGGGAVGEVSVDEGAILRRFPASTTGGPEQPARSILRDASAWSDAWAKANAHVTPTPKAPTVDFEKGMVALAAMGRKSTAGYSVEIVGAREEGGKLLVLFVEREPAKEAVLATVVTAPWHAVVVTRSDLPVEWRKYEAPRVPAK